VGTADRNIYSGTVVCGTVLGIGVWFVEIVGCSLTHRLYENHSYLQSCEL
jgi:hypothetical protein